MTEVLERPQTFRTIEPVTQTVKQMKILANYDLIEGDMLEVVSCNGELCLEPVAIYSDAAVARLDAIEKEAMEQYARGELKVYSSVDEMFAELGIDLSDIDLDDDEDEYNV
jgi:hypothetical protein